MVRRVAGHHPALIDLTMSQRRKVLLLHAALIPHGGGQAVAAWALQGLAQHFDVTLLTLRTPDLVGVDRLFGTGINKLPIEVIVTRPWLSRLSEQLPTPGGLLNNAGFQRSAKRLLSQRQFDVVISTDGEMDIGQSMLQYVHFPRWHARRPEDDIRPIHRIPGLVKIYRWLAQHAGDTRLQRIRDNQTLVNSEFIAGLWEQAYRQYPAVLYPPVPGGFPATPWSARDDRVVAVSRLSTYKRQLEMIDVVEALRARGHALSLELIGTCDEPDTLARVRQRARQAGDWVRLSLDITREALVHKVGTAKYALHAMVDEHFGIAVAEYLRAGCIPFVHHSGGPAQIIDHNPALLWNTLEDAVEKIEQVLNSPTEQQRLHQWALQRGEQFSEQHFINAIVQTCNELVGDQ